jgi:uncharacterized ferritin-like protein (DUF455 family)
MAVSMNLHTFAHTILFGTSIQDKLVRLPVGLDDKLVAFDGVGASASFNCNDNGNKSELLSVPKFPGRPAALLNSGVKATFPALHKLHEPETRGEILHFFANHELLAMELMALVLLRFPDAPAEFRNGVARTISEEQSHMRLYIDRMKELGVSFGDLPVSDYFWKSMSGMKSPMDYVVQMSLTFEQANLDYSLFFMRAVRAAGDDKTADILERVFREEIGHVKHGVTWFNRWRAAELGLAATPESDWDAYVRSLPLPMTPSRAKGFEFSAEPRRQAGLSETFIRELRVHASSKGRPPVVWFYNPHCDSEIARGRPGFTPTEGARRVSRDLETVPMFLAREQDIVLLEEKPRVEWVESLHQAGFEIPEFALSVRAPKIGGIEPWGWSPESFDLLRPLHSRLVTLDGGNREWCDKLFASQQYLETGIGPLFSKSWSAKFLSDWITKNTKENTEFQALFGDLETVGQTFSEWDSCCARIEEILSSGRFPAAMVKAPYGTSGMQVKKVLTLSELGGPIGGWIKNTLSNQGEIVVEPYLDKQTDLSIQIEVEEARTRLLEVRRFATGSRHEYLGTYLGRKLGGISAEQVRFVHSVIQSGNGAWGQMLRDLGSKLREAGYRGPAGVDAFLWKDHEGSLRMKPLVELNPRWTMGRVALEIEKRLAPGVNGLWAFIPIRELKSRGFSGEFKGVEDFVNQMEKRYPLVTSKAGGSSRIDSGVIFTNDPLRAREVLTCLVTLPNSDFESPQYGY